MSNIQVGDKIRFSTELLKQIHEEPNHHSVLVVVAEIRDDGEEKIVVVSKQSA